MRSPRLSPSLVAFDFDGVLCDSVRVKAEAFRELYAEHGDAIAEAVADHHRRHGGIDRFSKIRHYERHLLGREADDRTVAEKARRFSALVTGKVVAAPLIVGARACLERLSARVPLYVISATPQEDIQAIVRQKDLDRFFRGVLGSPKGKADHLQQLVDEHRLQPSEALMVGDAPADLEAARSAGVAFVGITDRDGRHPFDETVTVFPHLAAFDEATLR